MPTTNQEKKLLEPLMGEKDDNLALERDMDPDLPPIPSGREKKDALTLIQAKELIATDQIFRLHFGAKAQDSGDDEGAARFHGLIKRSPKIRLSLSLLG